MKLIILAAMVAVAMAADSYVVLAPSKVRPGMQYSVSVNILKGTGDVTVTAAMIRTNDNSQVAIATAVIQKDTPSTLSLQIPENLHSGSYQLNVSGTGGLRFINSTTVAYSSKAMSILIQTDKAMYKPGQTVNFRVLGVHPDLSLYKGDFTIEIYDANSNKIKQWVGVPSGEGVITQMLGLSEQPVLGDWKIKATAGSQMEQKVFTIAEYVLPKFEVTVELPSYYVANDAGGIDVTVKAKYTYGKPVLGAVSVSASIKQTYFYTTNPSVQRTGQLNEQGTATINFPLSALQKLNAYANQHLEFNATVTEALTGIALNGTSTVQVYQSAVKLEFLTSNPNTFKPGLEYIGYLKVSQPDGLPVSGAAGRSVSLTTTVTAEIPIAGTTPMYYFPQTSSFQLSPDTLTLPDNGLVEYRITVPANATNLNVHAQFDKDSAYQSISKSYSPSNNYIQLSLRSSNQLAAGGHVNFDAVGTETLHDLIYQVMSRGSMVTAGRVHAGGASHKTFSIPLTPEMSPNARIVVYYVRADGEIVTDSISFDVDGAFQNKVSVSMSKSEAAPADSVNVTVHASPQSTAYLLAVDQSVLLLKSGNDITADQVIEELRNYDTTTNSQPPVFFGGGPIAFGGMGAVARRKRMIFWHYPTYYGGSDANQIFTNAGVMVMTDCMVYHYVSPIQPIRWEMMAGMIAGTGTGTGLSLNGAGATHGSDGTLQEVERVRSVFPETWLWSNLSVGADGVATVTTTVPDTITSWITSAFAINSNTGLGVAPTAAKLRVFKPFFVTLNLPYSVVRGEQVVIQAIVFNYLATDQNVHVTMAQSHDFYNLGHDANGHETLLQADQAINVMVPAGQGKSVYFPIVASTLHNIELVVSAQSSQAADAVRRRLLVQPEGVPKEFSVSVLVDLKDVHTFDKTVPISLPPNVVADSARARITAIGDLMGPTVNGLDSLLTMPTGCGEQTMLGMAPDVFVSSYLTATNQLAGDIQEKAIKYMESGYQRELTYQHKDGSFSAFGDQDPSGSMWLTAFVAKTFHQAKPYVFIDNDVISRAIDWMLTHQNADGSFPEPGRVIHTDMQGGSGAGNGLTAFVLIALEENNDLPGSISQRISAAKTKAIAYLKAQLPHITEDYILSLTSYALTLAGDADGNTAFTRLLADAITKDGLRYWHKASSVPASSTHTWTTPQAESSDVEMTSYALLTYAAKNDFIGGLDVMKWLAQQRNPHGGFASTQDTVLALQALSQFARMAYSNNFNIQVSVTAHSFHNNFAVNQGNALVLQSVDLPSIPSSVSVHATGSGIALVEIAVFFNVEAEVQEPMFEVTVNLLQDSVNLLQIQACARFLHGGLSGMAVQEVGIPSGFEVDVDQMVGPSVLKRTEVEDRKIILYFDEIGPTPVCTTMTAQRVGMVAKSKPVGVRVYDYYHPEQQATAFYESLVLKSTSICDICAECGCPGTK